MFTFTYKYQEKVQISSLRDKAIADIGLFLVREQFQVPKEVPEGLLEIINQIADYYEEGSPLYPEILFTNDLNILKAFPHKTLPILNTSITDQGFKEALKNCAPLAKNGWAIYLVFSQTTLQVGIVSSELSETSLSLYNQTVGSLKQAREQGISIAYMRNIGQKAVEIKGLDNQLIISLTLDEPHYIHSQEITSVCQLAVSDCDERVKPTLLTFFEKNTIEALREGHGNLIAIVKNQSELINNVKKMLLDAQAIYLDPPINFAMLMEEYENNPTVENTAILRLHASLYRSMLNHDGITVLTTNGCLMGYHFMIPPLIKEGDKIIGGARSRAFQSMINSEVFVGCFYKSQDGNTKFK